MKCMLLGREMHAKVNPSLGPGDGMPTGFEGLPDREKPIVACAFRDFLLGEAFREGGDIPAWMDVRLGVGGVLEAYGCDASDAALRAIHRVARDYYAYGTIYVRPAIPAEVPVTDRDRFVAACRDEEPSISSFMLPGDGGGPVLDFLAREASLTVASRDDVPLDSAFAVLASFKGAMPPASIELPLREAGQCLSHALYRGYQEFKSYLDGVVGQDEAGRWLAEHGVVAYVRGTHFNLVATRPGTPEWWKRDRG